MTAPPETPFQWRKLKDDDMYGKKGYVLNQLKPNLYQFESKGSGSHVYLILGKSMNVLIDSGLVSKFDSFNYLLTTEIGLTVEDIDLIINTHEHFDHISTNCYFKCPIAAHHRTAVKIQNTDELIVKAKKHSIDIAEFKINIWLQNENIFDLGNVILKILDTPGHTSGSICIYEPNQHYLFSGDTFFKGMPSSIYESGSISELINSLQFLNTLKISNAYPGHGKCMFSDLDIQSELNNAITGSKKYLQSFIDKVKTKSVDDLKIPPSLYNRDEEDL